MDQARRAAGGLEVTGRLHILRHTLCSRLAMRGVTAKAIQELAGHADRTTTMPYMHPAPLAKSEAIRLPDAPVPARFSGNSLAAGSQEVATG